ncbi:CMRF35-like molecule 1 isoform X2 [Lates calcarifer]|uniref:CMRF35-like molecule 1 isoform X1 n=1 Tax=Lates calcarifer TaxID=8187 RepID=A0AAJ8B252_LATCA|nr:CMRF35-like molecule 1 isoform X1 [Lates calcarifer]XP_050923958.1 CMRF35-like molecule 1 isoform X2 [Lates calcarifer]
MWSLQNLLFIICIALICATSTAAVIHVSGYEERDVNVSCSYGEGYESYEKYLCRNDCGNSDVLVKTTEAKKNKYSIYDDKKRRVFTTTLSDLSSVDAGKYWCGVTRTGKDIYTEVRVEVEPDSCCDRSTNIQSYEGGSVSISCSYESEDQNNLKYICRGKQPSTCLQQALITSDNKRKGRFRLTDDKESRKFTVNITSLTQEDSGSYLCGVHRNTGLDVFSAAELEVKDVPHFTILIYVVPAILVVLLILTFFLVMVHKNKCNRVPGDGVTVNINTLNTAEAGVKMNIYDIEDYVDMASLRPQDMSHDDDTGKDKSVYQNFTTTEDIDSQIYANHSS